jgi:hypothetical protein
MNVVLNVQNKYLLNFNYFLNREEIKNFHVKFVRIFVLQVWLFLQNMVIVIAVKDSPSKTSCDTTTTLLLSPSEWQSPATKVHTAGKTFISSTATTMLSVTTFLRQVLVY